MSETTAADLGWGRLATAVETAPAVEPVTFGDLQAQSRIDDATEQALVETYITAARKWVENYTRYALITQTWDAYWDSWPTELRVPLPPLQSVTSITYIDGDDASQTLASSVYQTNITTMPGTIRVDSGQSWPALTNEKYNPIVVRFVAGYGDAATDVPEQYRQAIQLLAAHWYENREPISMGQTVTPIPMSVMMLVAQDRLDWL